ncbi:uncharacterized protein LOC111320121 [Stylophora pistillata]|nr:uncharacterized protein LOC111320121 [Stylophora pistillata]
MVSSETALALATSSSIVSPAPTLSLKTPSSIASLAAALASTSVPLPSSKISSGKSLSLIPYSSVTSSTVSSLLMPQPSSTSLSSLSKKIQELANDTISEFDSLNITSNNSLQEAANLFENFTTNYQNMTLGEGQPGVEKLRTESIFKVAVAFEKIVLTYGKYHIRGTNRSKRISYPHRNLCEYIHGCLFRFVVMTIYSVTD